MVMSKEELTKLYRILQIEKDAEEISYRDATAAFRKLDQSPLLHFRRFSMLTLKYMTISKRRMIFRIMTVSLMMRGSLKIILTSMLCYSVHL